MTGKINKLKTLNKSAGVNYITGIEQYEEFIDLEIYCHQALKNAYMFKYKTREAEQKAKLDERLPKLEQIVDALMFQRLRWDIHFYTPKIEEKKIEESKTIQQQS